MTTYDWKTWHDEYDIADSSLSARLAVVRERIATALDEAPPGPLIVLSLCAGQGRDLLPILAEHPRREDVTARLVEFDPDIADTARITAAALGLSRVEVVTGDAALTDQYTGLAPADIVIACGIFGNISDDDVHTTIAGCRALTKLGGVVLWTRHRNEPNLVPRIEEWFEESGFSKVSVSEMGVSQCVGVHRHDQTPTPLIPNVRLFTFRNRPEWAATC